MPRNREERCICRRHRRRNPSMEFEKTKKETLTRPATPRPAPLRPVRGARTALASRRRPGRDIGRAMLGGPWFFQRERERKKRERRETAPVVFESVTVRTSGRVFFHSLTSSLSLSLSLSRFLSSREEGGAAWASSEVPHRSLSSARSLGKKGGARRRNRKGKRAIPSKG